jgi:hypothetical protein
MNNNYAIIENEKVVNTIVSTDDFMQNSGWTYIQYPIEAVIQIGCDVVGQKIIQVQPYPSWELDSNYDWQAPTERPADGKDYEWDEDAQAWVEIAAG